MPKRVTKIDALPERDPPPFEPRAELDRREERQRDMHEVAGAAEHQLQRHLHHERPRGRPVGIGARRGSHRGGGDPRPVEERAAAAGDHVERAPPRPHVATLVVVDVAREIEEAIALEAQLARLEHPRARLVLLAEGDRGIGGDEPDARVVAGLASPVLEVGPRAGGSQGVRAADRPPRDRAPARAAAPRSSTPESHRTPRARAVCDARPSSRGRTRPRSAPRPRASAAASRRPRRGAARARRAPRCARAAPPGCAPPMAAATRTSAPSFAARRRKRRPKPSSPSYQSWLPGMPRSTRTGLALAPHFAPKHFVPRRDDAAEDFHPRWPRGTPCPPRTGARRLAAARAPRVRPSRQTPQTPSARLPGSRRGRRPCRPRNRSIAAPLWPRGASWPLRLPDLSPRDAASGAHFSGGPVGKESGRIQSRESTDSLAIAVAMKLRK